MCNEDRVRLAQRWCSPAAQGSGVLQRQHLFNVYIHPLPDYGYFPEESIFRGREIEDRIQVCPHIRLVFCQRSCPNDPAESWCTAWWQSNLPKLCAMCSPLQSLGRTIVKQKDVHCTAILAAMDWKCGLLNALLADWCMPSGLGGR